MVVSVADGVLVGDKAEGTGVTSGKSGAGAEVGAVALSSPIVGNGVTSEKFAGGVVGCVVFSVPGREGAGVTSGNTFVGDVTLSIALSLMLGGGVTSGNTEGWLVTLGAGALSVPKKVGGIVMLGEEVGATVSFEL